MTNSTDGASSRDSIQIDTIVVIPTLNEAATVAAVVFDLMADAAAARAELWVVDGGSTDGTRDVVRDLSASIPQLRWFGNPDRIQASAVNLAALEARRKGGVRYLIRADAHARYPSGWISRLIAAAEEEGADSVVVPMRTCGGGAMRDASADLFNSWLGNGGSAHRAGKTRGFVEHGHHALFRLDAFLQAGGYDPRFLANEDAELDVRLGDLGRRIFLENRAAIDYFPRASLSGVFRQFRRNGRYRMCTSFKHRRRPGLRQLAPMLLTAGVALSLLAGIGLHPAFLAPAVLYAGAVFIAACIVARRKTPQRIGLIAATAMTAHLAFGLGALSAVGASLSGGALPLPPARASA